MTLSTQPYKGARDFYPEDKRIQTYMFDVMKNVCEEFGYEAYDAPILEPTDLFLAKGNQEIVDEQTYTFTDRGNRSVTIRTEMTPSVSRMVAGRRQELAYPLRWYSIPNVWRYERTQRGRLREFWQLNVDIFGVEDVFAEHEMIVLSDQILKRFGAKPAMYRIQLNSRKLTNFMFGEYLGLGETQSQTLIRLIDRMHKMEPTTFNAQVQALLTPHQRDSGTLTNLQELLKAKTLKDLPEAARTHESARDLQILMDMLDESGVTSATFDATLMRGFDYYTDIVFEVSDNNPENNRSMFGGGRYDGLVGMFGVEPVPTVGFGMGDVTLQLFLEGHGLLPELHSTTDIYMSFIGETSYLKAQHMLRDLRSQGLHIAVDNTGRRIDKQIKAAVKKQIKWLMVVGEAELSSGRFNIKNLHTGDSEEHGLDRIVSIIKDYRRADEPEED
ncbi:MAG: histidine--tRNA ligase [Candidatus Saccharimonadales bacterium]